MAADVVRIPVTQRPINDESTNYVSRAEIVKLVGIEAGERLVGAFGGTRFSVPVPESAGFEMLAATLKDRDAARKLCIEWGGLRIVMPVRLIQMRSRIREMARLGAGALEISRELRITERYVYRILAEDRAKD